MLVQKVHVWDNLYLCMARYSCGRDCGNGEHLFWHFLFVWLYFLAGIGIVIQVQFILLTDVARCVMSTVTVLRAVLRYLGALGPPG